MAISTGSTSSPSTVLGKKQNVLAILVMVEASKGITTCIRELWSKRLISKNTVVCG